MYSYGTGSYMHAYLLIYHSCLSLVLYYFVWQLRNILQHVDYYVNKSGKRECKYCLTSDHQCCCHFMLKPQFHAILKFNNIALWVAACCFEVHCRLFCLRMFLVFH